MNNMFRFPPSIAIVCIVGLLGMAFSVSAFMGSSNYRINQDSINIGGLDQGSSSSYWIKDTMGEAATGESGSETYKLHAGYREMDEVYISLSVTSTSLPMTAMNMTVNVSANTATSGYAWTVKTDSPSGYALTLKTDRINALYNTASSSIAFTDYTTTATSETIGPIEIADDADNGGMYGDGGNFYTLREGDYAPWGTGWLGKYPNAAIYPNFFRFQLSSAIPSGSTITNATIAIWGTTEGVWNWNQGSSNLAISATDSANAPRPTSSADGPSEFIPGGTTTLTTASSTWPASGGLTWNSGASSSNTSPSIANIIQELVDDNSGLASGAYVTIWVYGGDMAGANEEVDTQLHNHAAGNAAQLTIESTPPSATVPIAWNIPSGNYMFGFSAFGADTATSTWGNGVNCQNPGTNNLNYAGFTGDTAIQIATSNSRTTTTGTDTKLCLAAEQKETYAPSGSYQANITATVNAQ